MKKYILDAQQIQKGNIQTFQVEVIWEQLIEETWETLYKLEKENKEVLFLEKSFFDTKCKETEKELLEELKSDIERYNEMSEDRIKEIKKSIKTNKKLLTKIK